MSLVGCVVGDYVVRNVISVYTEARSFDFKHIADKATPNTETVSFKVRMGIVDKAVRVEKVFNKEFYDGVCKYGSFIIIHFAAINPGFVSSKTGLDIYLLPLDEYMVVDRKGKHVLNTLAVLNYLKSVHSTTSCFAQRAQDTHSVYFRKDKFNSKFLDEKKRVSSSIIQDFMIHRLEGVETDIDEKYTFMGMFDGSVDSSINCINACDYVMVNEDANYLDLYLNLYGNKYVMINDILTCLDPHKNKSSDYVLGNELKACDKNFPFEDCKVSIYEKQHDGSMIRTYKKFTFNFDKTLSSIIYDDNKIIYNKSKTDVSLKMIARFYYNWITTLGKKFNVIFNYITTAEEPTFAGLRSVLGKKYINARICDMVLPFDYLYQLVEIRDYIVQLFGNLYSYDENKELDYCFNVDKFITSCFYDKESITENGTLANYIINKDLHRYLDYIHDYCDEYIKHELYHHLYFFGVDEILCDNVYISSEFIDTYKRELQYLKNKTLADRHRKPLYVNDHGIRLQFGIIDYQNHDENLNGYY